MKRPIEVPRLWVISHHWLTVGEEPLITNTSFLADTPEQALKKFRELRKELRSLGPALGIRKEIAYE